MNSYLWGLALTGILIPLIGIYIKRRNARIDLDTRSEANAIDAHAIPINLLRAELAKREAELADVRRQDRDERVQYIRALTAIEETMKDISADLRSHRDEEKQRAHDFHARLNNVDTRLTVIETRLEK